MPSWAEGLLAAYALATVAVGIIFATATDLSWMVKLVGAVLWPATLVIVLMSLLAASVDR